MDTLADIDEVHSLITSLRLQCQSYHVYTNVVSDLYDILDGAEQSLIAIKMKANLSLAKEGESIETQMSQVSLSE
jgi:hypothetical protein